MKCEVHDRVRKHAISCTKKRVPRFLILETLSHNQMFHFALMNEFNTIDFSKDLSGNQMVIAVTCVHFLPFLCKKVAPGMFCN